MPGSPLSFPGRLAMALDALRGPSWKALLPACLASLALGAAKEPSLECNVDTWAEQEPRERRWGDNEPGSPCAFPGCRRCIVVVCRSGEKAALAFVPLGCAPHCCRRL